MTQARSATLAAAFEATDYCVQTGDEWCQVNIGSPCSNNLRLWLQQQGRTRCAWIITAYNPQGEQTQEAENNRRDTALRAALDAAARPYVPALNRARDGSWPDEPGFCVLDMDEGRARALGLRFGQAAIVAVPLDEPVQLVWVDYADVVD